VSKTQTRDGLESLKADKRDKDMPRASAPGFVEEKVFEKEGEVEEGDSALVDEEVAAAAAAEAADEKTDMDIAGEFLPEVDVTTADVDVIEDDAIKRYVLAHLD
jgi:hypothetical protein